MQDDDLSIVKSSLNTKKMFQTAHNNRPLPIIYDAVDLKNLNTLPKPMGGFIAFGRGEGKSGIMFMNILS